MITLVDATITWESWESVFFQPVLKAYPTCHSWIITADVSRKSGEAMENVHEADGMNTTTGLLYNKSL